MPKIKYAWVEAVETEERGRAELALIADDYEAVTEWLKDRE